MKKTLGALIAQTRREKGMTQLELAGKMGVTDKAVSKWERDLACPDVQSLPTLADVLGLSLEELMQGERKEPPAEKESALRIGTILRAVALAMGVAAAVLPMLDALGLSPLAAVLAIGAGTLMFDHVNNSGFWVMGQFFHLDTKQSLKYVTLPSVVASIICIIAIAIFNAVGLLG